MLELVLQGEVGLGENLQKIGVQYLTRQQKKAINGVKQMPLVKSKTYNELVKWRDERLIKNA